MNDGGQQQQADRRRSLRDRILLSGVRGLAHAFFRTVEVTGLEHFPRDRGGLLVAWHPNSLIDPTVLSATCPERVVFGAKHTLFSNPLLSPVLRAFGAVPIFRANDYPGMTVEQRRQANAGSLVALAESIAGGNYAALFPEGVSHDDPFLAPLKTGAARIYYAARASRAPGEPPPAIVPVGLHYDDKHLFRSRALVWFYPPLELPASLDIEQPDNTDDSEFNERVRELTALIEQALTAAVHPTEDWTTHRLINRVRKLIRAERAKRAGVISARPTVTEKILGFARVQSAYYERLASHPEAAARLRADVETYDEMLTALGLDDHELDATPRPGSYWRLLVTAAHSFFVFLLLPPMLLLAYLVNLPPALAALGISRKISSDRHAQATYKLATGAVLFPLTWLATVFIGAWAHQELAALYPVLPDWPLVSGSILAGLSMVGAVHMLSYQSVARQSWKNLRIRFRRRRLSEQIAAALQERRRIFEEVVVLSEGLVLPGELSDDGSLTTGAES